MTEPVKMPKVPEKITVTEIQIDYRLVIAALVLGVVLGALIIVMLPTQPMLEDGNQ